MQQIARQRRIPGKISPTLGVMLAAMLLVLVLGGYHLGQWLNPGQRITPRTVDNLEEVPMLIRYDAGIDSIAFNPQPNADLSFVSSSDDGLIKLWHLDDQGAKEILAVRGGWRLALSPDGKLLASIDTEGAAKLWDLTQIDTMFRSLKDNQPVYAVRFSPDGQTLVSANADGTVKLWNWRTGQVLRSLKTQESGASFIAFSPDGQTLASGNGEDGTIKLWNWKTGKVLRTLKGDKEGVSSIAFSPNGQTLAIGGAGGTIKLWDWRNGQAIRTLPIDSRHLDANSITFSPDGQTLASDSNTGISLWNWSDGREMLTIEAGQSPFAVSPDGQTLASNSDNGTIKLWNRSDGRLIRSFRGREKSKSALMFSPDGQTLISASYEGRITLWNQRDGTEKFSIKVKVGVDALNVALSPDGQTLAIGGEDKTIKLLPLNYEAKLTRSLNVKLKRGRFVAFSPDQQHLILAGIQEIKLLRLNDRQEIWNIKAEPDENFLTVALSPNAQTLASGGYEQPLKLWNLRDGQPIRPLGGDDKHTVLSVAFSPDGQILASANPFEKTIQLWNLGTGHLIRKWDVNRVVRVVFSPDGQLLASDGLGGEIQLWNPQTGQKLRTLKGHASGIGTLAFSPDGQTLASGSEDQTIKLWRVKK